MINKFKRIFGNGIAYGIYYFLLCHLIGFIGNMPAKSVLKVSIPVALITLLINGLIYSRFTKREKLLKAITFQEADVVNSKLEGIANHQVEDDLVSGKLCITEEELIFISSNKKEYRWSLTSFASFHFYPTIFNKGGEFVIKDQNGRRIMFEVDYIKSWKNLLS
ncbi:hypothetical protein [Flavobacterium sp. 2]|uniref:hypothetical protein n=1 Tax=Flavobacterium sp. 2 TaxID=308053 RepID=UPI003CE6B31A